MLWRSLWEPKHEDPDATGMAHYLEHMLFKGTDRIGTTDYESEKPHLDSIELLYEELALIEDEDKKNRVMDLINTKM